jgi:predicted nucleic acid-binding protein
MGEVQGKMSHSITEFLEGQIYLDTMMFYIFLRAEPEARPAIGAFFERIEKGTITAYTSVLTFDELAYRLILALIKDKYGGSPLNRLRNEERAMLIEFVPVIVPKLQLLKAFPHLHLVGVGPADLDAMLTNMLDYSLRPRDALHLAAMRWANCANLASNDQHFDAIPDITRFAIVLP